MCGFNAGEYSHLALFSLINFIGRVEWKVFSNMNPQQSISVFAILIKWICYLNTFEPDFQQESDWVKLDIIESNSFHLA